MSNSFPFLATARMRRLDYSITLRIAEFIDGNAPITQSDLDTVGISDYDWIKKTCIAEQKRRKEDLNATKSG